MKWIELKKLTPTEPGTYRVKGPKSEGLADYTGDGWAVFGDFSGNITHWAIDPDECTHAKMKCTVCGESFSRQDGVH